MLVKRHILFFTFATVVLASYVAVRIITGGTGLEKNASSPQLPVVEFYDKSGKNHTLDEFKGKVVLVNIWATWCPPCVAEMPMLDRLQRILPADKFTMVAISMDTTSMKTVTDFFKKQHIKNLTLYWDKDRQIPLKWKYEGLPTSFLLDREGHIIKQYDGPFEWDKGAVLEEIKTQLK